MKPRAKYTFYLAAFIIFLSGCSSGKKAYEKGNYFDAVMQAVSRLRQNPDHSKSKEILKKSYPMALNWFETDAQNQIASNSPNKWRNALDAYDRMNQMYEAIRQSPGALKVVKEPKNCYTEIGPIKEKAAEEIYNAGITLLMKGTREDAKRAYFNFIDANRFVPGYKDVIEYLDKAKVEATVYVVVEQLSVPSRYSLTGDFFQDKIEEYLNQNYPSRGFVKFYASKNVDISQLPKVDQILRLQFDDFSIGNTTINEKEETVKKDSVKVGEAKIDGKTIPVFNTVTAKLTTTRKVILSKALLSMIIIDGKTKGVLTHQKLQGEYTWEITWGRFNGDERALTDQQLALCKRREQQPPPAQDLFFEVTKPIYNRLTPAINTFYRNY
jgi:tetratricopeptide (TPR) repeat protein